MRTRIAMCTKGIKPGNINRAAAYRHGGRWRVVTLSVAVFLYGRMEISAASLPQWLDFKGYADYTQLVIVSQKTPWWTTGTIFQNRLECTLYPVDRLTIASALRTRLLYGTLYEQFFPFGYKKSLDDDPGFADLSTNLWSNNSAVFTTMFDRLYVDYSPGDWQIRLGRHRINWGKDLIWNPNDIFNAQSFLDVSYREGPGTDALLVRRYIGPLAHVEAAVAGARDIDSMTAALCGQINVAQFDIQALGGWMRHDIVGGAGFSGQVADAALRGEGTVFYADSMKTRPQFVGCLSADYAFPRQVHVLISGLFNSKGAKSPADGFAALLNERITAKTLSPARFQLLLQAGWQVTPLVNVDCLALVNPADGSALLLPHAVVSMSDDIEVVLQAQAQAGEKHDQFGGKEHAVYGSVRWSF